ncbi:LOW QUALITY PROTEIN: hypothetical protein T265_12485 [Opisthorchis viverrini]|uniref:Uncharacterized protein n=1 Tax=Opisthorchis viverrini TaxID=6198 RepID=A0A075AJV1_OPIVI|nr:LOW QUALITY PROTEIN: hypothetical protein T265_12485 [Opisthorchis viverrini]KER34024.1 LOW QUALITY PROTEIN: hypothetical protein T265_12485 [Opisthorchis viverrini]
MFAHKQAGQQAALARTLDSRSMLPVRIKDARRKFRLRNVEDAESAAARYAEGNIVFSDRAEASLLDWIPVDSRLSVVRLTTHHRTNANWNCAKNHLPHKSRTLRLATSGPRSQTKLPEPAPLKPAGQNGVGYKRPQGKHYPKCYSKPECLFAVQPSQPHPSIGSLIGPYLCWRPGDRFHLVASTAPPGASSDAR